MSCDICGAQGTTTLAKVEGVPYRVCSTCAQYGESVREAKPKVRRVREETPQRVMQHFSKILRQLREKSGKTQDEFADMHGIKRADWHAWEHGSRIPTLDVARGLEKKLHISLIENDTAETFGNASYSSSSGGALTLGDLLKK